jgi:hypothetical protein
MVPNVPWKFNVDFDIQITKQAVMNFLEGLPG